MMLLCLDRSISVRDSQACICSRRTEKCERWCFMMGYANLVARNMCPMESRNWKLHSHSLGATSQKFRIPPLVEDSEIYSLGEMRRR